MQPDRRISLHKLEVLVAVIEAGGIGKAAEQLFVTQPVVTAHIRTLEQRLDTKIFSREGNRLELTEAGELVYEWAQDLLARTREVERHLAGISDGQRGLIDFGASMSLGSYRLPAIVTEYRLANPEVELRMSIADTEHILEDVRLGALDFAVVAADRPVAVPGLRSERLGDEEMVLVTAPGRPPRESILTLAEVATLPFIEAPGITERSGMLDQRLSEVGMSRNVVLQLGHPEARKRAARAGIGATILFRNAVTDDLEHGTLREVRIEGVTISYSVLLVSRAGARASTGQRHLIEKIRAHFRTGGPPP